MGFEDKRQAGHLFVGDVEADELLAVGGDHVGETGRGDDAELKRVQKSVKQQEGTMEVFGEVEKEDGESFFDASEEDLDFTCVECGVQCKDETHLRNHILAHYHNRFAPYIPAMIPFACPECGK